MQKSGLRISCSHRLSGSKDSENSEIVALENINATSKRFQLKWSLYLKENLQNIYLFLNLHLSQKSKPQ